MTNTCVIGKQPAESPHPQHPLYQLSHSEPPSPCPNHPAPDTHNKGTSMLQGALTTFKPANSYPASPVLPTKPLKTRAHIALTPSAS